MRAAAMIFVCIVRSSRTNCVHVWTVLGLTREDVILASGSTFAMINGETAPTISYVQQEQLPAAPLLRLALERRWS